MENKKVLCIYHSVDLDGWMSAAIVMKHYGQENVELLPWNYGDKPPTARGKKRGGEFDIIVAVDISLPDLNMYEIAFWYKENFIWIDHHQRKLDEVEKYFEKNKMEMPGGLRRGTHAACELAWNFFFPGEETPPIITLLGLYDSFRHKLGPMTDFEQHIAHNVWPFQLAARAYITNPEEALISLNAGIEDKLDVSGLIRDGVAINSYLRVEAQQAYAKKYEVTNGVNKFAVVNKERFNPANYGIDYHKDGYDAFICFWFDNGYFHHSIYNDNQKFDCAELAAKYGGGGHKGAAGFRLDNPIGDWVEAE